MFVVVVICRGVKMSAALNRKSVGAMPCSRDVVLSRDAKGVAWPDVRGWGSYIPTSYVTVRAKDPVTVLYFLRDQGGSASPWRRSTT